MRALVQQIDDAPMMAAMKALLAYHLPIVISGLLTLPVAALADPQGISRFAPVQIEDASTTDPGKLQVHGAGVYTRDPHDRRGDDTWEARPVFRLGLAPGLRLALSAPNRFGDSSRSGSGDLAFNLKYNFNQQSTWVPTMALSLGYSHPHGGGTRSGEAETVARLAATKWLAEDRSAPRLHLNAAWYHTLDPSRTNRENRFDIGVAYTQLVSPNTALVVDFIHAQRTRRGETQNFVDVGFNHQLAENLSVGAAVGVGIGAQSPDFRAIVAVRQTFSIW
jgi:hypothetical protein